MNKLENKLNLSGNRVRKIFVSNVEEEPRQMKQAHIVFVGKLEKSPVDKLSIRAVI